MDKTILLYLGYTRGDGCVDKVADRANFRILKVAHTRGSCRHEVTRDFAHIAGLIKSYPNTGCLC